MYLTQAGGKGNAVEGEGKLSEAQGQRKWRHQREKTGMAFSEELRNLQAHILSDYYHHKLAPLISLLREGLSKNREPTSCAKEIFL